MENKKTTKNINLNYTFIQQRDLNKIKYFKDCKNFFEDLNKIIENNGNNFQHLYNTFNKNLIDNDEKIHIITDKITEVYLKIKRNFQKLIDKIISKLNSYLTDLDEKQLKYKSFDEINKIFQPKKIKLSEIKNIYHKNGKELEAFSIDYFEKNDAPSKELDILAQKTKDSFNKYIYEITDIEKYRIDYNEKQKQLKEKYHQMEKIFIFDFIKEEYNNNLQDNLKIITQTIMNLSTKTKFNPRKKLEFNIESIEEFKSIEKEKIEHFSSNISLDDCINDKEFLIYDKAINYIKQNINDENLYPNYANQKENYNSPKRKTIISVFNIPNNKEITEEEKNELLNIINDSNYQSMFIIIMSRFRSNSERPKKWIDIIGECLNIILERSKEYNDYDMIKNCIILSQTYFYIENNNRIYLFSKINKKDYFNNTNFWKNYIYLMIIKQLKSYQITKKLFASELGIFLSGEGVTNELKIKFGDLLFTQLLTHMNNMIDFKVEKDNIVNVINYFNDKYKYLSENDYNTIISMISNRIK